jgi:molybdopterin-guanine dinucleotide biosynthesis protein A
MTGIVLAGGESRRMGRDKAFLAINGRPMIERVIGVLRQVTQHIIVVTNTPEAYAGCDVEITVDAFGQRGSIVGVYSGLLRSRDEYNIVVACDMPFLNSGLIRYMSGLAAAEYEVVLPKIGEFVEPLHAVYARALLPVFENHIKNGNKRIRSIFTGRRVRYVTEEEVARFDPGRRSFVNLNTVKEYEEAACSEWEQQS